MRFFIIFFRFCPFGLIRFDIPVPVAFEYGCYVLG